MKYILVFTVLLCVQFGNVYAQYDFPKEERWPEMSKQFGIPLIKAIKEFHVGIDPTYTFGFMRLEDGTCCIYDPTKDLLVPLVVKHTTTKKGMIDYKSEDKRYLFDEICVSNLSVIPQYSKYNEPNILVKLKGEWHVAFRYATARRSEAYYLSMRKFPEKELENVYMGGAGTYIVKQESGEVLLGEQQYLASDTVLFPVVLKAFPKGATVIKDSELEFATYDYESVMDLDYMANYTSYNLVKNKKGKYLIYQMMASYDLLGKPKWKKRGKSILTDQDEVVRYLNGPSHLVLIRRNNKLCIYSLKTNAIINEGVDIFNMLEQQLIYLYYSKGVVYALGIKFEDGVPSSYFEYSEKVEGVQGLFWGEDYLELNIELKGGKTIKRDLYKGERESR